MFKLLNIKNLEIINMLKITFICSGKYTPFHWLQHASIIINDLDTQEAYMVSYMPENFKKMGTPLIPIIPDSDRLKETCERAIITLYCKDPSKTLSEFKNLYEKQFQTKRFNLFTHNCTDATNLALDYFFPNARDIDEYCCAYDSLCCLFYFGTLGLKCFTPSCLSTPYRTFQQVKQLERYYGDPSEAAPLKLANANPETLQHQEQPYTQNLLR
jgi:hypothetical protein